MLRHHADLASGAAMHLVYSARTAGDVLYREELEKLADDPRRAVAVTLTREGADTAWNGRRGRVDAALLTDTGWPSSVSPRCYVCGPDSFVEAVANALVDMGHDPLNVKTERFGPTGG